MCRCGGRGRWRLWVVPLLRLRLTYCWCCSSRPISRIIWLVVLRGWWTWGQRWLGRVVRRWLRHKWIFMHFGLEENSKNKAFKILRTKRVKWEVFVADVDSGGGSGSAGEIAASPLP